MNNNENLFDKIDLEQEQARNNDTVQQTDIAASVSSIDKPTEDISATEEFETLHYKCPAPGKEFTSLSTAHISRLTSMVIGYIALLCQKRGATVNLDYWKYVTRKVFSSLHKETALVCPARAGYGKSTWILAFILTMCELWVLHDPLADVLGGVILVLQKVETLNNIVSTIFAFFPTAPQDLAVALQSWTLSGQEYGYCKNRQVNGYKECQKAHCPYAASCKILEFNQLADQAYILCMTQARFSLLRKEGTLDQYLSRQGGKLPRRVLIFDEKFDSTQTQELTMEIINQASTELENLARKRDVTDYAINNMQRSMAYWIKRKFQELRDRTVIKRDEETTDSKYGLCSLRDTPKEEQDQFCAFRDYLNGRGQRYQTQALSVCVEVIDTLFHEECLYTKVGTFSILKAGQPQLRYGNALTLIFDATAEVDGDYRELDVRFLESTPPEHMKQVTFYVYCHPDLNTSHNAMKKPWKLPAFYELVEEILDEFPGKTFLCTYMDFAGCFPEHLSETAMEQILLIEGKDPPLVPYWYGNNGSNNFNTAVNCILIGYPRLAPHLYLQQVYTYWRKCGVRERIKGLYQWFEMQGGSPSKFIQNDLPEVGIYEAHHLAARLEQEIYRCELRNRNCPNPIRIFLFAPPQNVLDILLDRFSGANVKYIDYLPDCVALAKDTARAYNGEPTYFSRFADFLSSWDGKEITLAKLLDKTEISKSGWKALQKDPRFHALLDMYHVCRRGRGPNVVLYRTEEECA